MVSLDAILLGVEPDLPEESTMLAERAKEIIHDIKQAYSFKTDKELSNHLDLSPQSIVKAKKNKVPIEWVFRCHRETGVSLDTLFTGVGSVVLKKKELPEVKDASHGIGKRLRKIRGGISLPDFAQSLGVHRSTIIRWEQDESSPDAILIRKICDLYQVDPAWLLCDGNTQLIEIEKVASIVQTVIKALKNAGSDIQPEKTAHVVMMLCKKVVATGCGEDEFQELVADLVKIAQ